MKHFPFLFAIVILLALSACKDQSEVKVNQLTGTWTGKSGQYFIRYTFKDDHLYTAGDTLRNCQEVSQYASSFYEYRVEKNRLKGVYRGITNGFNVPSLDLAIETLTEKQLILSNELARIELDRCE